MDYHGGLDNYLINTPDRSLASAKAVDLKNQIQERRAASLERQALVREMIGDEER
jgi:hypothetical protein